MQLMCQPQIDKTKGTFLQFLAAVCLGPISLGASIAWTSPVLPQLLDLNSTASIHITNEDGSWIGSMMALGALSSAVPAGILSDCFGRKKCTLAFAALYVIFAILATLANNMYVLCTARFLSGIATGGVSVVAPMYISEIADPSLRGTLVSFFELLIYVGIIISAVLGAYVPYKLLTIVVGVIPLLYGIFFCFLPESPMYLTKIKKEAAAKHALQFYKGKNINTDKILNEMKTLHEKVTKETNIWQILKSKIAIRGLIACVGLTSFQQLCGIDGIIFYNVQIFQQAGANVDAYTSSVIVSIIQLLSALLMVFLIEKASRRMFLFISSTGTCISLAILALYFHLQKYNIDFAGMGAIPLISMICYNISFAMGLGPIPWMINGEMFTPEIKGVANGITIATNWTLLFAVTKTLPIMLVDVGPHYTFYMYSGFMVICTIFIKFCIPETKGKTLLQIQEELNL